jgi:hypothetical protein
MKGEQGVGIYFNVNIYDNNNDNNNVWSHKSRLFVCFACWKFNLGPHTFKTSILRAESKMVYDTNISMN